MTLIGTFTDGTVQLVYEGRVEVGAGGTGNLPKPVPTTAKPTEDKGGDTPGVGGLGGEDIPPISEEDIWTKNGFEPVETDDVQSWDDLNPKAGAVPQYGKVYYDENNAYLIYVRDISSLIDLVNRHDNESLSAYIERLRYINLVGEFIIQINPSAQNIRYQSGENPFQHQFSWRDQPNTGDLYLDTSTNDLYLYCKDNKWKLIAKQKTS